MNLDSLLIEDRKIRVALFNQTIKIKSRLLDFFSDSRFPLDVEQMGTIDEIKSSSFDLIILETEAVFHKENYLEISELGIPLVILTSKFDVENILENFRSGIFDLVIRDEEENYLQILPHVIERAAMVQKQRSRERILSYSVEAIDEALFICDMNDSIVFVNQAFCSLYGYSYLEVLGKNVRVLFNDGFASDSVLTPRKCEEIHLKKSGEKFPVLVAISDLTTDDNHIRIGISTDLTNIKLLEAQLRKSQTRLQLAQRMARLSSWEWNFSERSVTWSEDQIVIFGVEDEKETNARTFLKRFHADDISLFLKSLKLLKKNKSLPPIDIRIIKPTGELRILNLHFSVTKDSNEKVNSIFVTLQDITERKELEEELSTLNKKKDKFFSIISHDLKSPFNAILGITELLHTDFKNLKQDEIIDFVGLLNVSTKRAIDLLNNLLLWSRVQLGTVTFNPKKINISQLVQNMILIFSNPASEREVTIRNNMAEQIIISVDEEMFNSILSNLISNAIKFNKPQGEVSINLTLNDKMVHLSVRDNGVGISSDDMQKLFKIETHVTEIGSGKNKGTGLGLILCNEFIKIHGGELKVESEVDNGSIFSFTLPIDQ